MDQLQYLLTKLAEEASEVAQIALKTSQFGPDETMPGQPLTNFERCHLEIDHLMGQVELLNEHYGFGYKPSRERIKTKKAKVATFLDYSIQLGQVSRNGPMTDQVKTSESHPLRIDTVQPLSLEGTTAAIGMSLCPGKHATNVLSGGSWRRSLTEDLDAVRAWGATVVVSLLEEWEFADMAVADLTLEATQRGMTCYWISVKDGHAPDIKLSESSRWRLIKEDLLVRLKGGEKIFVHCRGGLGRTGTYAAELLMAFGETAEAAIARVRASRPGAIETDEQVEYLKGIQSLVLIESPFAGDEVGNILYARACMRHALSQGFAPLASHLLYTQPGILDDHIPAERQQGIDAGLAWREVAHGSLVYTDKGVSSGMKYGMEMMRSAGKFVRLMELPPDILAAVDEETKRLHEQGITTAQAFFSGNADVDEFPSHERFAFVASRLAKRGACALAKGIKSLWSSKEHELQ